VNHCKVVVGPMNGLVSMIAFFKIDRYEIVINFIKFIFRVLF